MSDVAPVVNGRNRKGQFVPGYSGGPGRPPGARNKLGEQFISTLEEDFRDHGAETLKRMREQDPSGYIKVIAQILPKQLNATVDAGGGFLEALRVVHEQRQKQEPRTIDVTPSA